MVGVGPLRGAPEQRGCPVPHRAGVHPVWIAADHGVVVVLRLSRGRQDLPGVEQVLAGLPPDPPGGLRTRRPLPRPPPPPGPRPPPFDGPRPPGATPAPGLPPAPRHPVFP